ncbi:MAG: efflux RND transporter permease subunit, partial [Candidatus Poribacteria bacterium]|nr:efflux RND transporter permease subunit [Candidatus Poribacteria bacterium]
YVQAGPEMRRGIAEKDGLGEVVSGVVVMRQGGNALDVIRRVKEKIADIEAGLPEGVKIVPAYDRSGLILRAIETLKHTLTKESLMVALVIVLFLWHVRSAFVAVITLPVGVLIAFIVMHWQGLNANVMSLGGIAIAVGAMVDASIVMVENVHKTLERDRHEGRERDRWEVVIESSKQVGPSLFFSLMIIAVSFLPVFPLQAQEGRLFRPLAFTKTYAMAAGAILSVTLVPVLMGYFIRGNITPEEKNPLNRFLIWLYRPMILPVLRFRWLIIAVSVALIGVSVYPLTQLGSEFMPPLDEGDLLYMPSTAPGISVTEARKVLQVQDRILKQFPEVDHVLGKIGRADSATDPAPLDMVETVVVLKPREEWGSDKTTDELIAEMDAKLRWPGVTNMWTMPIKNRVDMLATGVKTPIGVKVYGSDLPEITNVALQIERVLRDVPDTRSVFAERLMSGNYVDFEIDRDKIARYGLTIGDVQDAIQAAVGGMPITTTVEGRNRFTVNVRYARELRDNLDELRRLLIPVRMMSGASMPVASSTTMGGGGIAGMGGMADGGGMSGSSGNAMASMSATTTMSGGGGSGGGMDDMSNMNGGMSGGGGGGITMSIPIGGNGMSSGTSMGASNGMSGGAGGGMGAMATPTPNLSESSPRVVHIPLAELAEIVVKKGPMAIKSENGLPQVIVFVDVTTQDIGGYVKRAKQVIADKIAFPAGVYIGWSGQYEFMQRAQARLKVIVPLTALIIFVLLYMNHRNVTEVLIVMLSLPFAVIGGIWLMYLFKFNMSVAAGVGFIALAGLAVETAVVMLLFLDVSHERLVASGAPLTKASVYDAIIEGAALRVRPKMMTVATTILALVPIFWEEGSGSEVMRRMATPMVGGLVSSLILTLIVIPAIYAVWKGWGLEEGERIVEEKSGAARVARHRFALAGAGVLVVAALAGGIWWMSSGAVTSGPGEIIGTGSVGGLNYEVGMAKARHGDDVVFWTTLTDANGEPVTDAEVTMRVFMPAMPSMGMPEMSDNAPAVFANGRYESKLFVEMAGSWDFTVTVARDGKTEQTKFPIMLP